MFLEHPGAKILVAEPDRTIAELLRIRFDVAGYQTLLVRSGGDLLEALRVARPAALVLELRLPGFDGYEILARMRGLHLSLPVLAMGKDLSAEDIRKAIGL